MLVFLVILTGCGSDEQALPAAATPPAAPPPPPPPNIVLISVDTLRADHLGCYGYFRDTSPNIDAFAREALFFEQAFCTMSVTLPSHVSLFTGLYPLEHGILANIEHGGVPFGWRTRVKTFAQFVSEAGYETAGFVSALPLKRDTGIAAGFEFFSQPRKMTRSAEETNQAALAWLR
ncbi:MAG: sulfatase-like hydrolase/transferase [Planctomycetes bacterium]|nr:sulfatase-like hydrolase/transferase [Planctomycetota bacterium]